MQNGAGTPREKWHIADTARATSVPAAAQLLAYALGADDTQTWLLASVAWEFLLTRRQLAPLAFASLAALDPDDAEEVVTAALGEDAGPLPTFISEMDDARFWAALASRRMLKAYALAGLCCANRRRIHLVHPAW